MTYSYHKLIGSSLVFACLIVGGIALSIPQTASAQNLASCRLPDGTFIQSGQYRLLYSASSVVSPTSCTDVSGYRICYNGTLHGDPQHNKMTCTEIDATAPQVSLTAPAAGATVSGIVAVSADATDATGVLGVRFSLDGKLIGTEDTSAPYTINWDSKTTTNGAHTLAATARDAAGNRATSTRSVTVQNTVGTTTVAVTSFSGVDTTGATDSTTGILAAIGTGAGPRKVTFPCGTFLISQNLGLPSDTEIAGAGTCTIIKLATTTAPNPVYGTLPPSPYKLVTAFSNRDVAGNTRISIHDLTIDSTLGLRAGNIGHLVFFSDSSRVEVRNVRGLGNPNSTQDAFAFVRSYSYTVAGNYATGMANACYDQWDGVHDFVIEGNTCEGAGRVGYGIIVNGIGASPTTGSSSVPNVSYNGRISNNIIRAAFVIGLSAYGLCSTSVTPQVCGTVHHITINDNTIEDILGDKMGGTAYAGKAYFGIKVDGTDMVVSKNTVRRTYRSGIAVGTPGVTTARVTVADNTFVDANMGAASTTAPTTADAIAIGSASSDVVLQKNNVSGTLHRYALRIDSGVMNASICPGTMAAGTAGLISDLGTGTMYPCAPRPATIGYIIKVLNGNGVAQGWAFDRAASSTNIMVNFYLNNSAELGGTFIGSTKADTVNMGINWQYGIDGNHGFSFRIPDNLRDGQPHALFVQPVGVNGRLGSLIHATTGLPFTVAASSTVGTAPVIDASCLDDTSRCPSVGSDYLAPNYSAAKGWSDGKNYFKEWQCTSTVGINNIARLNILPLGTIGPNTQKDSTFTSWYSDQSKTGVPAIYFVVASADKAPVWSMKKAIYSSTEGKWNIYSVLDSPTNSGGLSSQVGRGKYFVMNDYALPGFGPSSPVPGSQNKIPGVSNVNANPYSLSYPLVGSGPLGITAITNAVWTSTTSGGPQGRTCVHMNPKLMDYDANGSPQTLLVNMWQNKTDQACPLPAGAPIAKLPYPGAYLYRYKGATLGWQLDLDKGLITDSLYDDTINKQLRRGNLLAWTDHTIVEATWDGVVYTNDLGKPKGESTEVLLDCKASGMHFGEGSGRREALFFLGVKPDIAGERAKYGLSNSVLPGDIYFAFKN